MRNLISHRWEFEHVGVFQTTNQQRVYERCAKAMVEEFLNGYNATILVFGQIGSGKTFTMVGDTKVLALVNASTC